MSRRWLGSAAALVLLVVVVVGSWWLGGGGEFVGADAAATQALEEAGAAPWLDPLVELGSGELESGLFALQAALGGAVLGYAVGVLRTRRRMAPPAEEGE